MSRRLTLWSVSAAMVSAMAAGAPASAADAPTLGQTTVLSGLQFPWDMAFLSDGTMFFTEKCRGLSVRLPSGDVNPLMGMNGAEGFPSVEDDLFCEGQAGMMGVAVDPDFASNRQIYVYSTSSMTAPGSNRVLRLTVDDDAPDDH